MGPEPNHRVLALRTPARATGTGRRRADVPDEVPVDSPAPSQERIDHHAQ
ncbi:hypothetical protein GCM10018787_15210 [Streptomyces thermodiastaticus]|nr:hypothetical protein GCM10018787_15210 [Streptomyces thermodiastaticus]